MKPRNDMVEEALEQEARMRDAKWSGSIAVGSKEFVEETKEELGTLFMSRKVEGQGGEYELRERQEPYGRLISKIGPCRSVNAYQWQ